MGQGQDPQHEEIHGQQEVDVLLGEYLGRNTKRNRESGLLWLRGNQSPPPSGGWSQPCGAGARCQEESLTAQRRPSFCGCGKKRGPPDAPPGGVGGFALRGSVPGDGQCCGSVQSPAWGSWGSGLGRRVPRRLSGPKNSIFTASSSKAPSTLVTSHLHPAPPSTCCSSGQLRPVGSHGSSPDSCFWALRCAVR